MNKRSSFFLFSSPILEGWILTELDADWYVINHAELIKNY